MQYKKLFIISAWQYVFAKDSHSWSTTNSYSVQSFVTSCISMAHSWMGGPSCDWHNGFQSVMLTCLICDTDTGVQSTMSVCRFGWRLMAVALCLLWYTAQRSPPCVHLLISIFSYTSQAYATWIPPIIPLPSSHKTSGCAFASCSQQAFSVCSP